MFTIEDAAANTTVELRVCIVQALSAYEEPQWVYSTEATAERLLTAWALKPLSVSAGAAGSLIVDVADINGTRMVLKIPAAKTAGRLMADAFDCWGESPVPTVRRIDSQSGAWLMEHLVERPGHVNAVHAHVLASTLQRPAPPANGFPHVWESLEWRIEAALSRSDRAEHPSGAQLEAASITIGHLLGTTEENVLLHGDYQAKNIVFTAAGPHAIDPLPCIGDRHYDMALWVATGDHPGGTAQTAAELSGDPARFAAWAWSLAVLEQRDEATSSRIAELEIMASPWLSAVTPLAA